MKHGTIQSPSVSAVSKRQAVLSGLVSSGQPAALSIGSGLSVLLSASASPMTIAFAYGFDQYGGVNFVSQLTSNQTFTGLTANTICYLYVERNVATGALSLGFTTVGYGYGSALPASPATNSHFYHVPNAQMQYWNGSIWVVCQRVFVGECTTGASTVSSVITYAYNGTFVGNWLSVVANTTYAINHNLGVPAASASPAIALFASITGADSDAGLAQPAIYVMPSLYGFQWAANATPWKTLSFQTRDFVVVNTSNVWSTSGFYKLTVARGW